MYGTDRRYRGKRSGGDDGFGGLADSAGADSAEAVLAAAWAAEPVQAEAVATQPAAARAEAGKNVYRKNS